MDRSTVIWQRLEGALVFAAGLIVIFDIQTAPTWWAMLLIFFAPDLSFAGYLVSNRVGAFAYNLAHNYGIALGIAAIGFVTGFDMATTLGLFWTAHAGFDRMLGYGLKAQTSFHDTHLGRLKI